MAAEGDGQTGTRIRERRLDLGLRQADLATALGISASYLNLIEHNRRRIAGRLLADAGRVLEVDANLLTQGADRAVLDQLRAAAAGADTAPEVERTEELATRYPGWSKLIAKQQARIATLETRVEEISDRMTHDPELATSLHAVISAVTSIRSTAAILTSDERLDADWVSRFHKNIHDDAIRLAGSSDALVRYLDAPADQDVPLSPFDEVAQFFDRSGYHIATLEEGTAKPSAIAADAGLTPMATQILSDQLSEYARRAQQMPLAAFMRAVAKHDVVPDALATHFDASLPDVLHRLANLPAVDGHPQMGLAVCDASGGMTFQKAIAGFALSHSGSACPLWPLFTAIGQPDRPIQRLVALPGQQQDQFLCHAIATQTPGTLHMPPVVTATMLVIAAPTERGEDALPLGPACRICPRNTCPARREPSALGASL